MSVIHSIVYKPINQTEDKSSKDYLRVPAQRARLIANHGIEGDQKAGHHPDRQLNLISQEWLESIQPLGYKTGIGQFGEQIIIAGLAVETLQPGVRVQLGAEACIEVTKARTGCSRLEAAQGKSIEGLGALGVMAKVITGGHIAVGDPVVVVEASPRVESVS